MQTPRFLTVCLLSTAALLSAQQPLSASAPAPSAPASAHKGHASTPQSYRITISFKRTFHGKIRTDRTYSLLATVGEMLPAIRDDAKLRTDTACSENSSTIGGGTDVDMLTLKPHGSLITVALKISMQTIGLDAPDYLPKLPVAGIHQYLVTPTIPIGRRVTVYTSSDAPNNTPVEVQLLVEPFDPNATPEEH